MIPWPPSQTLPVAATCSSIEDSWPSSGQHSLTNVDREMMTHPKFGIQRLNYQTIQNQKKKRWTTLPKPHVSSMFPALECASGKSCSVLPVIATSQTFTEVPPPEAYNAALGKGQPHSTGLPWSTSSWTAVIWMAMKVEFWKVQDGAREEIELYIDWYALTEHVL